MSCENLPRILFTPYPIHSDLGVVLPLFDFNGSSDRRQSSKSLGSRGWVLPLVTGYPCLSANPKIPKRRSIADRQEIPLLYPKILNGRSRIVLGFRCNYS